MVSENEHLAKVLQNQFNKPLQRVGSLTEETVFLQNPDAEIIFDVEAVRYADVIAFMNNHGKRFTYKMKPAGADFIIGSNSSDDRGKVIDLKTE